MERRVRKECDTSSAIARKHIPTRSAICLSWQNRVSQSPPSRGGSIPTCCSGTSTICFCALALLWGGLHDLHKSGPQTEAPDPPRIPPECAVSTQGALPEFAVHRRSVPAPRCALGTCCLPRQTALAHLHDHRRLHNSVDELRIRSSTVSSTP